MISTAMYRRQLLSVAALLGVISVVCSADEQTLNRALRGRKANIVPDGVKYKVPRLLHFSALSDAPPEYLSAMVDWSTEKANSEGFEVMIWRDQDADELVRQMSSVIPGLAESWEHVKRDASIGAGAKRADFMRPLILYELGGVYSDADMIPCDGYEGLVDMPGVVSFPHGTQVAKRVGSIGMLNGALWSAPPKHRLNQLAMEYFISLGPAITTMPNLEAAGPVGFGIVADMYFKEIGAGVPSIGEGAAFYANQPVNGSWIQIADIRFVPEGEKAGLFYHLSTASWSKGIAHKKTMSSPCVEDLSLIKPFLNWLCQPESCAHNLCRVHFGQCGESDKSIE